MQLCRGKELQPFFPIFPFPSLLNLPTFPFPSFPFPIYPTFLLPSPFTSLPCSFRSSLYSSFTLNLTHFLSTFPFPSQSSPFPPNLPRSYFSSSLPISFTTYILPYLSTSLSSPSLPLPLPHLSLFSAVVPRNQRMKSKKQTRQ